MATRIQICAVEMSCAFIHGMFASETNCLNDKLAIASINFISMLWFLYLLLSQVAQFEPRLSDAPPDYHSVGPNIPGGLSLSCSAFFNPALDGRIA